MTTPIPAFTMQELGVIEAARCGTGVGSRRADAEFGFGCGNGKLAAGPSVALDLRPGEVL